MQVAAWDGGLSTLAFSDRQEQQAEEQGLGGRHGHLKQRVDRCFYVGVQVWGRSFLHAAASG